MKRPTLIFASVLLALALVAFSCTNCMNKEPTQYSMETKQAVVDGAMARLQAGGLAPQIAGLTYGADDIELLFYGKADQEAVGIVKSVIDELAPCLPLKIVENVTVETQTS